MGKVVHMAYSSSLSSLCEINSSFDTGVLRIAYTGANRNGSFISKETFERCIETLYNCPIVCHYDRETDTIGGHDMELVTNADGDMRLVNMTIPIGVIPESSKYFWSVVEEEDGTEHEYLCADVLIWKRQEAYKKIKEDGITAHSMELTVKDGEMEGGLFVIKDFEFTAFCLLGDEHEPCFESSALGLFSYDEMKKQMAQMMSDLKEEFSLVVPPVGANDTHPQNHPMEGGEKVLNEKLALVAEYGLEVENLEFSIEDLTLEELREKFEAMKTAEEPVVEPAVAEPAEPTVDFALAGQIREEIYNALSVEKIECCWGEMTRYRYVDHDHEALQVYCYDAEDWKLYGINAEIIIGDIILGNNLRILDNDGKDALTVMDDKIEAAIGDVNEEITKIKQTNDEISITIQELADRGVTEVTTTTGFTFNAEGLTIYETGKDIENKLNNEGMQVSRISGDESIPILTADTDGVDALNLRSRQFLIIGDNSRFENYDNGTEANRTACFHITLE